MKFLNQGFIYVDITNNEIINFKIEITMQGRGGRGL